MFYTRVLYVALVGLVFSIQAVADEYVVSDVVIDGNQRVDTSAIKQQLKKTSGAITTADITEDVKSLYKTGFFEQVTAGVVRSDARAYLRYSLVEKPVVRKVFIKGNKEISEKDLSEIFIFDSRRFMDAAKVQALIRQAVSKYQMKGYHDASIEYTVLPVGENQVDITFTVTEGERYSIHNITIKGLKTLDEDEVKSVMQTKRYKWWSSWLFGTGRLNQDMLDNDRTLVRQYMMDHGLVDAVLSEPMIETDDGGFNIIFEVDEGPVYKIGKLSASGDLIEGNSEETLSGIQSKTGETFSASSVREDSFKISDKFSDEGYAFANVVPNTYVDRANARINIDFVSSKGNQVTINRINIKGNEKTYDHVIRRELKVDEQELYSGSKVKRSQELLQRLGYFEEVSISQEPVGDDKVNLNVNVKEGSTGAFSAGAGYSTSDGALFNTRISENNLFGTGRRAVLNVDIGTERNSYVLSFEDRRINDTYLSGGVDILRTEREYEDFDRDLTGGDITLGYPMDEVFGDWAQDISSGLKYEWLDIDITSVSEDAAQLVKDSKGRSTASGFTPRLVRNTINNPLNPSKGSRQEVSVELTGMGGDQEFFLLEGKNTWYAQILEPDEGDLVFSWRFSVGYGETFNDQDFPLYRRYFPGGINSVRGYKARSLGPKDANGHEYGGSKELVNNFDLLFPLVRSAGLKFVTFYDFGQAYDDDKPIDLSEVRQAYGFGLRWSSPIGPIRLEFGFPIDREEDEDSMVTMFSFGAPL